ncbi:hypothetical protein, partial [Nitrospirillum amazonense]|uniref:hypothetical protein n=1 Tax=Nitrospirillum amazonense TaxID=28077 RepID=UPI0024125954
SWPAPCAQDGPKGGPGQGVDRLPGAAALAAWPAPVASDAHGGPDLRRDNGRLNSQLKGIAHLSFWPAPKASDASGGGKR